MSALDAVESFRKSTVHLTTDYVSRLRSYIRESEELIACQKAAAANLQGDKADLSQKLIRWLEHTHATQVAELARVEKITPKS